MEAHLRKAVAEDIGQITDLIASSVRGLARDYYDERQIELSIKSVFGVDTDLIEDQTYFVAVAGGQLAGCGGWSKRRTLYGASSYRASRDAEFLDPTRESAKIRAFFIHPDWARKGIGRSILKVCETEAAASGFRHAEMMSTLPGVPLYTACGYVSEGRVQVAIGEGRFIECVRMRKDLALGS